MTTRNIAKKRPCTATRADSQPCRAWARHDTDPPRCAAHSDPAPAQQNQSPSPKSQAANHDHNLYAHHYSREEQAALQSLANQCSLLGEMSLVRVALNRLLHDFDHHSDLTHAEMESRATTLYQGAYIIGKLAKLQVDIEKRGGNIHPAMAAALDELSEEWNIDL